jgi:predicted acetyltransferase
VHHADDRALEPLSDSLARPHEDRASSGALEHEFSILERLMQLYLYDFAAIDDWPIADDGRYGKRRDDQSASGRTRRDVVLRARRTASSPASVLVRDGAYFAGAGTRDISEFFILRRHRRRGVGTESPSPLVRPLSGKWEVTQLTRNVDAQAFLAAGGRRVHRRPLRRAAAARRQGVMQRFDKGRR